MFNVGFDPLRPWLRFQPPEDLPGFRVGLADGSDLSAPPPSGSEAAEPLAGEALPPGEAAPRAWWEPPPGQNNGLYSGVAPPWPWLRAPADEAPGFRIGADGSAPTGSQGSDVRLMSGALAPLEPQEQPDDVAGSDGMSSADGVPLPPPAAPPSPTLATSVALPAAGGATVDLAALAARAAPVVAGAGSAAAAALPFLLIPTNTQSETTELGDGHDLRARVRPGQRSVEIERRVDNGLFGTGLLAKWETLPVEAWQHVGRDGSVNTVINHEQLNQVLGRSAPSESMGAGASAMARPPKDADPPQPPPTGAGSTQNEADVSDSRNPPAPLSLAPSQIDSKVLEEAKQRDPEEERVLACRAVRAMPGQPAPPGQYSGAGGVDTAVGIRVAPGFPAPKGGYDYNPDYLRHWNGYRGELELKNRIENAVPYEKIVHYGNPAGDHGPDVLSIGPDGRPMEWNSKSRSAPRRVGRHMTGVPTLRYANAKQYVDGAIASGSLEKHVGDAAMHELSNGNYNVCTVGTGNAYDGYFQAVRNGIPAGLQR